MEIRGDRALANCFFPLFFLEEQCSLQGSVRPERMDVTQFIIPIHIHICPNSHPPFSFMHSDTRIPIIIIITPQAEVMLPNPTPTPGLPITYLTCPRGGLHEDQKLNLVCLQTSCLENLACCCACVETDHRKHLTKPLKFVIDQARREASSLKSQKMNIDVLLELTESQRRASFELFENNKKEIIASLGSIEMALQGYYNSIVEQIILKNTDGNLLVQQAVERTANATSLQQLKLILKKLVSVLPGQSHPSNVSQQELISSLEGSSLDIRKSIGCSMLQANKRLRQHQEGLLSLINNLSIWNPPRYKFTQQLKHQDIKLLGEHTVKAVKTSGYKFAIMEPGVQGGKSGRRFAFKVKESNSNWLAVGVCHKKVVQGKGYGFVFGSTGHGAYMVSSNGGSWSHLRADQNNSIKAFKFSKGDVVEVTLAPQSKIIHFRLGKLTYELPYQPIHEDELHPCVLFYYVNDQVQYLHNYKPE